MGAVVDDGESELKGGGVCSTVFLRGDGVEEVFVYSEGCEEGGDLVGRCGEGVDSGWICCGIGEGSRRGGGFAVEGGEC